jgi:DNA-binding SARP family transcriptional activator
LADVGDSLGPINEKILALLIECLYLSGGSAEEMKVLAARLERTRTDPRLAPATEVALAFAAHRIGSCGGACERAAAVIDEWRENGAAYEAAIGDLSLAVLAVEHDSLDGIRRVFSCLAEGELSVADGLSRVLIRRVAPFLVRSVDLDCGPELVLRLMEIEPSFWITFACQLMPAVRGPQRSMLLGAIQGGANPDTARLLSGVDGADAQEVRRKIIQRFAPHLYLRSFGSLAIHLDAWETPPIVIGRRRTRLLLGLLIANYENGLTRDQAIDLLWPDADPDAAVNSLNQTVFQLRRLIEPNYREGESPQYVISNVDAVQLNPEIVTTDLRTIRNLVELLATRLDSASRTATIHRLVDLVRGEYLADLKYEDWVGPAQLNVHSEVRAALLPIARGASTSDADEWALRAGCALAMLDPYDEDAHVAMVRHLAMTGRRSQARNLATEFVERLREDLDEEPSAELLVAARMVANVEESSND